MNRRVTVSFILLLLDSFRKESRREILLRRQAHHFGSPRTLVTEVANSRSECSSVNFVVPLITKPPEGLAFSSLAELYERFCELLAGRDFHCPRNIPIIVGREHFFHLTKLQKGAQTKFDIATEEPFIKATTQGFGAYRINEKRSETLSWIPEILGEPHEIWEYETKKTADEVFIREYDKPGSPFRTVLLVREGATLRPVTCMTVRRTGIKEHRRGKRLWP